MKRPNPSILIILGALLILAVFFALLWPDDKRLSWRETYDKDSEQPYGTRVLYRILDNTYGLKPLEESFHELLPTEAEQANYVFVGDGILYDSLDEAALLQFVQSGNTAFLSTNYLPEDLSKKILSDSCNDYADRELVRLNSKKIHTNFTHPELRMDSAFQFVFMRRSDTLEYPFQFFSQNLFCEPLDSSIKLGYMEGDYLTFVEVPYGNGRFLLHSIPLAFSNFHLIEPYGWEYYKRAFAHLDEGQVYFDNYSHIDAALARRMFGSMRPPNRTFNSEGPLLYILNQPSLAWAWYIGLALVLLYLLFRAKRKQRVIPVLEPNTNTSLEFIDTIGRLYFLQNNHRKLALQKMKLFLAFIRDRYHLPTRDLDGAFAKDLHIRSEVPLEQIQSLLRFYKNIERGQMLSEKNLEKFHQTIQRFHQLCK